MAETIAAEDGTPLFVREWPCDGALGTVVVVHGLGEHVGRCDEVARFLNGRRWRVVGYDQRGHGQSGGPHGRLARDDDLLRDLAVVVDAARRALPAAPLVLFGDSLGGLVAARFIASSVDRLDATPFAAGVAGGHGAARLAADSAEKKPAPSWTRPVDGLVLASPALATDMTLVQRAMLAVFGRLAPDLAVGNGIDAELLSRDAAVVAAYLADPLVHDRITARLARFIIDAQRDVREVAPRWPVPTLVVYAGADRIVAPAGSREFAAAAPKAVVRAREFPALFHEVCNEPEKAEVFAEIAAWLDTLIATLPRRGSP